MPAEEEAIALNDRMVAELVRQGAIEESRVQDAFRTVRRHLFVPDTPLDDVYRDRAVVTHRRPDGVPISSSSQPTIMARMLRQLRVQPGHRVLEIGAGTGYNAALLAYLVGSDGEVITVELDPDIATAAEHHLRQAGASNVSVVVADGWTGVGGSGPFDRIEATVGVWDVSPAWVEQLRTSGLIVVPLWLRAGLQGSVAFQELDGRLASTSIEPCGFMRLRGPGAGQAGYRQVGSWTVSLDEPNPEKETLLAILLQTEPSSQPAPVLSPGWFTPIALCEHDAVHLFSLRSQGAVIYAGVLDAVAPGLAVVESDPTAGDTIHAFGDEEPYRRLLELIDSVAPVDVSDLVIKASPAREQVDESGALAMLTRPNFSFLVYPRLRCTI